MYAWYRASFKTLSTVKQSKHLSLLRQLCRHPQLKKNLCNKRLEQFTGNKNNGTDKAENMRELPIQT